MDNVLHNVLTDILNIDTIQNNTIKYVSGVVKDLEATAISVSGLSAIEVAGEVDKTISLKINPNDKFLTQSTDGLSATLSLVKVTSGLADDVASEYFIADKSGAQVGEKITIYKDQFLKEVQFVDGEGSADDKLQFTFITSGGTESVIDIPLSGLFNEYTQGAGIALTPTTSGFVISGVVDGTSELRSDINERFLTIGANGFKVDGIQTAIDTTVNAASSILIGQDGFLSGKIDVINGDESTSGSIDFKLKAYDDSFISLTSQIETISHQLDSLD